MNAEAELGKAADNHGGGNGGTIDLGAGKDPSSIKSAYQDAFIDRHIGPSAQDIAAMLSALSSPQAQFRSLDEFVAAVIPAQLRLRGEFELSNCASPRSEIEALQELKRIASKNKVLRSLIGLGYYGTFTPPVIQRNILENPGWYTQYTPYQPEISQGRLEALLNFQTMVSDLTALPIANASLLDEATAAAEAMSVCLASSSQVENDAAQPAFVVSERCHPQTIAVVQTRAEALGVKMLVVNEGVFSFESAASRNGNPRIRIFGALLQYPATDGAIIDYRKFIEAAHASGALVAVACDLLALALLTPPGELGADIALGSAQRFGVPFGYGGPHAAFLAVRDELKRLIPGRLVGVSKDSAGRPALRLSLQTREQHIRREKATSNICTAQVLLAVMASMFAVYHGPQRLKRIAQRVHSLTCELAARLVKSGCAVAHAHFFDTLRVNFESAEQAIAVHERARKAGINLRPIDARSIGLSLDELSTSEEVLALEEVFLGRGAATASGAFAGAGTTIPTAIPQTLQRTSAYLQHPVFQSHHSETEFLRYLKRLESKDLSLGVSMIALGSCTMKLNATSEMLPVTWQEFSDLHPFAPVEQARGYAQILKELEQNLKEITGFAGVSLQPNSGAQGEYAGLLVIRAYQSANGEGHRNICLIPRSAHGTNPASAVMAGLEVVVVDCDPRGNIDVKDLKQKARANAARLSTLMVTYPSTHGVFEGSIKEICRIIHSCGGQVYMDGANLNALVGLVKPAELGMDLCHINLHKTFCIPHGGGGPGMGPIAVKRHLVPFLPSHPLADLRRTQGVGPVSAAPWGSAGILVISWMYMRAMGAAGLKRASEVAILNANYIASRLKDFYPLLYSGESGLVAHECVLDLRSLKTSSGIEVDDIAKRLMDYGFHAPTVSWPVAGTLMIEPTESESKQELDRFCDAMISIYNECQAVGRGEMDRSNNPLKNAPHTPQAVTSESWNRPYTREQAAFPAAWTKEYKFWPAVGRIESAYGDRNLVCVCPPVDDYAI